MQRSTGKIGGFNWLSLRLWLPLALLGLFAWSRFYTLSAALEEARVETLAGMQRSQTLLASRLLLDLEHDLRESESLPHIRKTLVMLGNTPEIRTVLLAGQHGEVIAGSDAAWNGMRAADVDPDAVLGSTPEGRTWIPPGRALVLSAYPIRLGGNAHGGQTGMLFIAADPATLLMEHDAHTREWMRTTNWVVAVFALMAWLLMHFVVTRRVGKLMLAVDSFRNQREDASSRVSGHDEIGRLGRAFDEMVQTQVQYSMKARKLSQAVEQSAASVIITDQRGIIEFVNPAFTAITGYSQDEAIGKSAAMLTAGQTSREIYRNLWETINGGGTWRGELLNRRKNGELYWDTATISPVRGEKGEITHFAAVQEDITRRKEVEGKLLLSMHVLNSISEGVAVTDAAQKFSYVNPAFTAITGYGAEEVIGKSPRLLSSGLMEKTFYGQMWADIEEHGHWQGEIIDRRKNGESFPEWLSISTLKDERGQVSRYVSVFMDISERKEAERRVIHMAQHDFLTGLPNRMLLLDRLAQAIKHAMRDKTKVAIMFLDLDRFKHVNDTLGHPIGDKLLVEIASRITKVSRAGDTVSRLGGDEFVIMLPGLETVDDISGVADKVLQSVAGPCTIEGREIEITTSLGISVFPDDGGDGEALLHQADSAMYQAKQDGRNNYRFFTAEMNRRALERLDIEHKLRHALARNELSLYYQPQIDRANGCIMGAEALIRWDNPSIGTVAPELFIPVAEETGLIIPIGEWALREACRQNAAWHNAGRLKIAVAVNLSTVQFRQKNLGNTIRTILEESGLDPAGLELEITESAVINDAESAIALLHEIKALGVKLVMDDFGTGYSSLTHLKRLPIDKLKIDQSFVRDMAVDADDAVIVDTIINMARNLGLKNIAEGVETAEQIDLLARYGCDGMQGYYFGAPMSAEEFVARFGKTGQS